MSKFLEVFEGIGLFQGECSIHTDLAVHPTVHRSRRVPFALQNKLKNEIERMESLVTKPTQWMRSLVIVEKTNGKLWVCPDPKDLNRAILRHHYPMITLEVVLPNCQKLDSSLSWMLGVGIGLSSYQKHLLTSLRLIRHLVVNIFTTSRFCDYGTPHKPLT